MFSLTFFACAYSQYNRPVTSIDTRYLLLTLANISAPSNLAEFQVSPSITVSVRDIPNGQDDLLYAMRHMAQLYYNLHILKISNIPMNVSSCPRAPHHHHRPEILIGY